MLTGLSTHTYLPSLRIISDTGKQLIVAGKATNFCKFRPRMVNGKRVANVIRAMTSSGDSKSGGEIEKNIVECDGSSLGVSVRAVITIRKKMKKNFTEKIEDRWETFVNGFGKGILIKLISEDFDPVTKSGKSVEFERDSWLPNESSEPYIVKYGAELIVPRGFGQPGAIVVTNFHDKEFFLMDIVVHGFSKDPVFFGADTWIHSTEDNPESRIIFKNQAYLPSQTPAGIKDLRREDLLSLRGNGKGERQTYDRVYDYDVYNDLGSDKDEDLVRSVIGNKDRPYPRRCRTGRPRSETDPLTETRVDSGTNYVPRDETFEEIKQATFSAGRLKAQLQNVIPQIADRFSISDGTFSDFSDIDDLYNADTLLNDEKDGTRSYVKVFLASAMDPVSSIGDKLLKFDVPDILQYDKSAWVRDTEYARQTLAGSNPVNIELLKELPLLSKLDPEVYGPPESAITKELIEKELNGISVEEAIRGKKLFILDYHDLILPFVERINSLPDRKTYASRTIFYYSEGILTPIVIELALPPTPSSPRNKYIFTHGSDATSHWLWKLARTHACSNDVGVHQLVNHWLRTHACMEPYIIATHRQLSSIHPVYKLLHPHMRYTMEMNALARQILLNASGPFEDCFTAGKYALELCSSIYKSVWRFDKESLPADLLRRGMAVEDASAPGGVKLVIEDYPYAADGLLIWAAFKELVDSYVNHYYSDPNSITSDVELQAWWNEIKNKGHPDMKDEPWWPTLNSRDDLSNILITIIWTACQHAAVNFGQYAYGGYTPNRPTLMRKLIPREGEPEYEKFVQDPEYAFLSSLPSQLQSTKFMAVQDILSTHSADEEYISQLHDIHRTSFNDPKVQKLFEAFSVKMEEAERIINQRNNNAELKNRCGAGVLPYDLLIPFSQRGTNVVGVPNSISI